MQHILPGLKLVWADGGYAGKLVDWVATVLQRTLSIVKRPRKSQGFRVLQWRWIVERTFGWLNRSRRLSKDFDALPETTEAWIRIASPIDGKAARSQNMIFPDRLLAIPSRTTRLLIGKTDFQQIHDIQMREIEAVLSELVEINAAMFHAQNEQYLGKLFPEPAPQKAGNGNGAQEEPDEFDAD